MPVLKSGMKTPDWCELESFKLISLMQNETITIPRTGQKEEIMVCNGMVRAESGDICCQLPEGHKMDLNSPNAQGFIITAINASALIFHASGRWESVTSSGIFFVFNDTPPDIDTPYDYKKTTSFDNHYHDCDEYWIFFQGKCRAVSEGKFYDVGPGDCVATGMGWHHDVQSVTGDELVKAVWFEGTLEGKKRTGHLWEPIHGIAEPRIERI
ncbi:MAG: cupin domain-containing protein [Armatimonadota bacterium]